MSEPNEKVIILTGASRGIGLAIAHYLLTQNHKLVLLSRTQSVLAQLHSQYGRDKVEVLAGDVSSAHFAQKAVQAALDRWDRLDSLIVNHGTLEPVRKVADSNADEWRRAFDVNVFSAVELIQASLPALRATHGRIILTSSGSAVNAYHGWGPYGAGKAVLNHLAQTLAVEEPNVTTISVRPGNVDTEMQREIREQHHEHMSEKDRIKFANLKKDGVLLRPEQPGHVIAKLAVGGGNKLSGRFLPWNDDSLQAFQDN